MNTRSKGAFLTAGRRLCRLGVTSRSSTCDIKLYKDSSFKLHVFTHGLLPSIFSNRSSAIGVVVAMTNIQMNMTCRPIALIGGLDKDTIHRKDSIAYNAILGGLYIASNIGCPSVDIISDNQEVITNLRLGLADAVHKEDIKAFERCNTLANTFSEQSWIHTKRRHNKTAVEIAVAVSRLGRELCEFTYMGHDSVNTPLLTSITQFMHADFVNTYSRN